MRADGDYDRRINNLLADTFAMLAQAREHNARGSTEKKNASFRAAAFRSAAQHVQRLAAIRSLQGSSKAGCAQIQLWSGEVLLASSVPCFATRKEGRVNKMWSTAVEAVEGSWQHQQLQVRLQSIAIRLD